MKINEPIINEVPLPISKSAEPINAYYLRHCAEIERGPSYAACLSRLHDIDGGRSNERTAQCERAVRERRCIAHGMREQEKVAGHALFFFRRAASAPFLPVKVAGDFGVLITNLTDPAIVPPEPKPYGARAPLPKKPAAPAKTLDDHLMNATTNGFAEAITAAAAEAADTPVAKPEQTVAWPMVPETAAIAAAVYAKPARPPMQPGETPLQYARRLAAQTTKA